MSYSAPTGSRRQCGELHVVDPRSRQQVHRQVHGVFDAVFVSEGIRILRTPVGAPRTNVIAERWPGTVRHELLDRMLIVNRRHLETVLAEYVAHVNALAPTGHCIKQHYSDHCPSTHHRPTFASDVATGSRTDP
jgi:integrase-like protein